MKRIYIILMLIALVWMVFGVANCGYGLSGLGKQVPANIKTVVIPDFENKTTRIEAEQFVTFAVKDEFIRRSELDLAASRANADAILEGKILTFDVTPISMTDDASANLYRVTITLSVRFINLQDNGIIFEDESIVFTDNYNIEREDFFSQETQTLRQISERFAESVVSTILENF
ncbi:MAG: LptE family protein [Candidatus Aminicenantes bacterium]|nr:LptE family protein [Candidatus Aminicenantes bacterium]